LTRRSAPFYMNSRPTARLPSNNTRCEGADLDGQVRPLHCRTQIGQRGAAPPHLAYGQLVAADAFLIGAVEIGAGLEPGLVRGGDERVVQFVAGAQVGDVERTAGAVIIVLAALLVLGAPEIRQHIVIAPAETAELAPIVEILALPADIDQSVDRAGAAKHFSPRPRDAATIESRHRFSLELPGDLRVIDVAVEPGRDMNPRVRVLAAGLDHEDLGAGIGRETVRQHAPGRPGSDNDEIIFRVELHQPFPCYGRGVGSGLFKR
jgi:hypothetical protein